jgi:hypothetical protein
VVLTPGEAHIVCLGHERQRNFLFVYNARTGTLTNTIQLK